MSRHYSLIRSKLLRSRTGNLSFPVSVPCQLWLQTTVMSFIICLCLRISFLSFSFSSSDKIRRIRSRISRANLPFTGSLFTFTPKKLFWISPKSFSWLDVSVFVCALGDFLVLFAPVLRQIARYLPHHRSENASKTHPKSSHDKFKTASNIANPPSILQSPTSPPSVFLMRSLRLSGRVSLRPSGKGEHSGCLWFAGELLQHFYPISARWYKCSLSSE